MQDVGCQAIRMAMDPFPQLRLAGVSRCMTIAWLRAGGSIAEMRAFEGVSDDQIISLLEGEPEVIEISE